MAFKDKDVVSLPGSPWDTILEAAKDQLPSLDSDFSLSDCEEEEPFIFQRNQPVLIPDLAEELAEDSVGDAPETWVATVRSSSPQLLLVPGTLAVDPRGGQKTRLTDLAPQEGRGHVWSCQNHAKSPLPTVTGKTPTCLEGCFGNLSSNTKGFQSLSRGSQEEAILSLEGEPKTKPSDASKRRALRRERRKMIEKDILQKVTRDAQDPACDDKGQASKSGPHLEACSEQPQKRGPVLSLRQLEDWDLDYILQSLPRRQDNQGDSAPRTAWWLADRCQEHTVQHSQDRLLEKLTLLCATQSRVCSPAQKVPADTPQDTEEQEAKTRFAVSEQPGFQPKPGQKLADCRKLKTEPPTIFIDLRQTEPQEPRDHQSPESSEHSSSDSEEEEEEEKEEVTAALGVQWGPAQVVPSSRELRDCTAKSQLLQQLRAFRKGASPAGQKAQALEAAAGSQTGKKKHVKLWAEEQNALALGNPLRTQPVREVLFPLGQP